MENEICFKRYLIPLRILLEQDLMGKSEGAGIDSMELSKLNFSKKNRVIFLSRILGEHLLFFFHVENSQGDI